MEDLLDCEDCGRDNVRPVDAERCPACQLDHDADGSEIPEASQAPDEPAPEAIEFRVTFGSAHVVTHASGFRGRTDGWLAVLAPDELAARMGAHAALDRQWSMIYAPGENHYPSADDQPQWYPRGEVGRLLVLTGGDDPTWRWLREITPGAWEPKPVVYAYRAGSYGPEDQAWVAMADDGRVVVSHISSSRRWGIRDVGPDGLHAELYRAVLGTLDVDYRVLPEGEFPPEETRAAAMRLAQQREEADREAERP